MLINKLRGALIASGLGLAACLASVQPALAEVYTLEGLEPGDAIPGQYIVVLKDAEALRSMLHLDDDVTGEQLTELAMTALPVDMTGRLRFVYGDALQGFAANLADAEALLLAAHGLVDYVEVDRVVGIGARGGKKGSNQSQQDGGSSGDDTTTTAASGSPQVNATWGLDRIDQRGLPLDTLYNFTASGQGSHAYILDTGIRSTHEEFAGRLGQGKDISGDSGLGGGGGLFGGGGGLFGGGLFGDGEPDDEPSNPNDCNGHGTHVAGTVGGTTWGVAKGVTIHAVRVLGCGGVGSSSTSIEGLDWVIQHAEKPAVVNMSLGGGGNDSTDQAVANTVRNGILVVAAAGNDDKDACEDSPGRAPASFTVASTDLTDTRSSFSNWGDCVDIFAPGSDIRSADYLSDNGSTVMSGTSMASPHVAGAAAVYLQRFPRSSPAELRKALVTESTKSVVVDPADSVNRLLYSR